MKLKDSELKSILAEVETEIESLLKSEGDALKKAKGDEPDEGEGSAPPAESAPAESAPAESAPAEGSSPAPAEGSAPPDASAAPAPDASPAPEASSPDAAMQDPAAAQGPVDPAALQAEYSKLPPEELKAHYMAAKAALFEMMGAAQSAGPGPEASAPAPAPAAGPGPEASSPARAPMPPAMKAEVPASAKEPAANGNATKDGKTAIPGDIKPLGKSESDSKIADLEQQIEMLTKAVDLALSRPERKAVTSVAFVPRAADQVPAEKPLTKSDVQDKIRKSLAAGKLTKNQKDKIFSYTLGNVGLDEILPILNETK